MDKEDSAKLVAGVGTAGIGSGILLKSLRKTKKGPREEAVEEVVRIVKKTKPSESGKKAGDYIYKRALTKKRGRAIQRKIETRAAGLGTAGWFGPVGRAVRVFSVSED